MAEESLKNRTINSVGWSAADAFLGQGVSFVVGLVLARLLSPTEYGLIGICLIFTTILNGIVDSGFSNALIRKREVSDTDYNTMFLTNMVLSVILYIILYFSAPFISLFFENDGLTPLIRAMGILLFINAMSIVQVTILTKKLDFKTKTIASLISAIISGILGILLAYMNYGVWALVVQQLSRQLFYNITLWLLNKWHPSFTFSISSLKYMWGFGWKLMVSGLIDRIWAQLYQVVVGKCYSPSTLGQYSRAKDFANIFSVNITTIVQRVSYPVLSSIQDDITKMIDVYRRVIKSTMFVTCLLMISLGAVSEPLIYCLIGPQWYEASTYLPLICISLSLYPLHSINLNMLQVLGRSDIFLKLEIIKKIIATIPILVGVFIGIYWMLVATIVTGVIAFFLNSYYTGKSLGYTSMMQLKDVIPDYAISFVVAIVVFFFKYLPVSYWVILPLQIVTGFILTIIICELIKLDEYLEIKSIMLSYIKRNKVS